MIPYFLVPKTINGVVIDHTDGLHQGITDGGSHKFKASFAHILAHGQGFGTRGWYLIQSFPSVLNGVMVHKLPEIGVETAKFRLYRKKSVRIGDKGPDLQVIADNTLVLQQGLDFGFIITGHLIRIEPVKCLTIGRPFIQNG